MIDPEPPSHIIDSRLFRNTYGTPEMRAVFSDEATLEGWLRAEAALARAEAQSGVIPADAAQIISERAKNAKIDLNELRQEIEKAQHPLTPAIHALERLCGDAGQYVHWGATTQDIMDTGAVLQLREALEIVVSQLDRLVTAVGRQARAHKLTVMAGRTHGQHAVPVTFGYKLAVLAAELDRHRRRLKELAPRVLVGQLAGAAGTLATLGAHAQRVREAMMAELGLGSPLISWHTARDGIAEVVMVAAMIGATCGKIGNEVINLQRTEIAEVAEPGGEGAGGSSTMPQKRNPMASQTVVTLARLLREQPARALDAMMHEHERDMSAWQMEWAFVPETFILLSGVLEPTCRIVEGLDVDATRMRQNLAMSGGLINSEAVMMRLADAVGRGRAKKLVTAASSKAARSGRSLADVLAAEAEIAPHLSSADIDALLKPEAYLGESAAAVDRVLRAISEI